jgi:nitrogenase molybdenum-cofactor synthesis protein NifE
VVGTSVKKSTKEDKDKIKEIIGDEADAHMIDDLTPREMYAMLRDAAPTSCCRAAAASSWR